jgi:hypothetical protein
VRERNDKIGKRRTTTSLRRGSEDEDAVEEMKGAEWWRDERDEEG